MLKNLSIFNKKISFGRILAVFSWSFIGWLVGSILGSYLFEGIGETILGLIFIFPGALWGLKSKLIIV